MMKMITLMVTSMIVAMMVGCADDNSSAVPNVSNATVSTTLSGDSIAMFVVYDASGSMSESVKNASGQKEAKQQIANRSLLAMGKRLDNYLSSNTNRFLAIGMVNVFGGRAAFTDFAVLSSEMKGCTEKFLSNWIDRNGKYTEGGTPLGNAITLCGDSLSKIGGVKSKHILILTDGMSNSGPSPDTVVPKLQANMKAAGANFGVHLIAFDTMAGLFDSLKKNNVTVLEASDEKQLDNQFNFILNEKILLEREE